MNIIYGVPVKTYEDLFASSLRPHDMMEFVRQYEKDISSELRGDTTYLDDLFRSDFYKLRVDFVPLDIIEKYALYKLTVEASKRASKCIVTPVELSRLSDKISQSEQDFEAYMDSRPFGFNENIMHVAIMRDPKTGAFIDTCLCVPRTILKNLSIPTTYKCSGCGATETVNNDLPDMVYTIKNNEILYYCHDCARHERYTVHVGDSFRNPYKEH